MDISRYFGGHLSLLYSHLMMLLYSLGIEILLGILVLLENVVLLVDRDSIIRS